MYHYDPNTALEELIEDATLPNPVHVRDMMLRKKLTADKSVALNRLFVEYQKFFRRSAEAGERDTEADGWVACQIRLGLDPEVR